MIKNYLHVFEYKYCIDRAYFIFCLIENKLGKIFHNTPYRILGSRSLAHYYGNLFWKSMFPGLHVNATGLILEASDSYECNLNKKTSQIVRLNEHLSFVCVCTWKGLRDRKIFTRAEVGYDQLQEHHVGFVAATQLLQYVHIFIILSISFLNITKVVSISK